LETVLISSNQTSNLTVNHSLEKIVVGFTFTTFNLIGSRTATNGRISAAASSRSRSASIIVSFVFYLFWKERKKKIVIFNNNRV